MLAVQLLRSGPDSPLHPVPLWARPGLAGGRCCDAALVREFRREARVVREGMEGDLIKVSEGQGMVDDLQWCACTCTEHLSALGLLCSGCSYACMPALGCVLSQQGSSAGQAQW